LILSLANPNSSYLFFYSDFFWTNSKSEQF
jgi:hypothetical protein